MITDIFVTVLRLITLLLLLLYVAKTMKNNINRVQKHVEGLVSVGEFLQSCFSWRSKIRTIVAFAVRYVTPPSAARIKPKKSRQF